MWPQSCKAILMSYSNNLAVDIHCWDGMPQGNVYAHEGVQLSTLQSKYPQGEITLIHGGRVKKS